MTQIPRQLPRPNNRLRPLLDASATAFARHGFSATTIRAIAAGASMTPGAIYVHFPSKDALLLAVYEEGVERVLRAVDAAASGANDPWARLEAVVAAHLTTIVDGGDYAKVMTQVLPSDVASVAHELRALRDRYERRIAALVDELELPPSVDARLFRLMLFGAMNWTPVWYDPESGDVAGIARGYVAMLRERCGPPARRPAK